MANFAQLGIQIDSKQAEDAARDLDALAAAGGRAEQSTKRLTKATQDQEKELSDLLGQIDPTVKALNRLDEQERKLAQFRRSGQLDTESYDRFNSQIQQSRQLLGGLSEAQNRAGMSARAYSAAMRNVPAQITDITTSLIGGQPAYLVALQQGGQLKDMFGGIVPAARALATSLVSMINPLTITAAIVGTLGVAFYQASARTEEINLALISTGRNATYTAEGIEKLAASIDSVSGVTQGGAISAITSLATTTNLTGEALTSASAAAASWASVTGQSADTVLDKFRAIAKDPVDALTKLNETERFLTQTQYERIKALQDEGRWQEAATEAAKLYADVVAGRTREVEANLGLISTAWLNIKQASSDAWDAVVVGVDKGLGPLQRYADKLAQIGGIQRDLISYGTAMLNLPLGILSRFGGNANAGRPEVIMPGVDGETRSPAAIRDEADIKRQKARAEALADWAATADTAASRENTLNKLRKQGQELGQSEAKINEVLNQQRAEWAKQDEKKAASANKAAMADDNAAKRMLDSALRQITANTELAESGEKVTASRRLEIQIEQLLEKEKNKMTAATRAELQAAKEQLAVTDAQAIARQQLTRDTAAGAAMEERIAQIYRQQRDQNEVGLMAIGRGSEASERAQRELNIRRDYLSEVEKLEKAQRNKNTELSAAEYQRQKELLARSLEERLALEQSYQDQRMAMQGDWRNGFTSAFEDYSAQAANAAGQYKNLFEGAFKGAEDAFVKFAMTGKLSFSDLAKSIIADLARIAAKEAIVASIKAISAAFGGASGSSTGSTQLGNNFTWDQQTAGWSSGGYTGPGGKYEVAGYVHRDEVVWNKEDVKAVGGPRRANAMRPTSGYASGGIVGGSSGMSNITNAQPNVEININMDGGTVDSQTQNGTSNQETMQLVNMIKGVVSQWYTEQSRTGGVVYRQQRGMAG